MNNSKIIIMFIMLLIIATGCQNQKDEHLGPSTMVKLPEANVKGTVLEVSKTGRILVDSETDIISGQIWIAIDKETDFFENNGEDVALTYSNINRDFTEGNYVEIFIGGLVAESYPMQAAATLVFVNEIR